MSNAFDMSRKLGHAKGLLQSLIIISELPEDVRNIRFMELAKQAEQALKEKLA